MKVSNQFRKKYSFEQRVTESKKILKKYPDKVPIIVTKSNHNDAKKLTTIDKNKFLAPGDITLAQFMCVIRKRISLSYEDSLVFFLDDTSILTTSSSLSNIYYDNKNEDGFLYLTYCCESTFG